MQLCPMSQSIVNYVKQRMSTGQDNNSNSEDITDAENRKKKMTYNIIDLILQGNANSEVRELELSLFNKKNYVHLFLASSYFSYEKIVPVI